MIAAKLYRRNEVLIKISLFQANAESNILAIQVW